MSIYIKGDTRPVLGKNIYTLMLPKGDVKNDKKERQHWRLLQKGKQILDLGIDGGVTFNQSSLGIVYTLEVVYTDVNGVKSIARLDVIPVGGKPSIQNLKWQDQYYNDLNGRFVGYMDNVRLFIHTLNIPVGDTLEVTIWEDEGTDGHAESSRNMGTYNTSRVDKYGKAELYFNNIKVYQQILNDKDYINESQHEFYTEVKYRGKINTIQDTIQLKIENKLQKMVEIPKTNSVVKVFVPDKQKKPENKMGVKVTVNVFFDGTLNNMKNTEARLAYQEEKGNKTLSKEAKAFMNNDEDDSSYDNYFSNIAIMRKLNPPDLKNRIIPIYIEGEGTLDQNKDDIMGYAFGSGDVSGIPIKVSNAFSKIDSEINSLKNKNYIKANEFVNEMTVNVFGFSRGAAAARNFVSQRRKIQDTYNLESSKFAIKFVGLFDTVSSYEEEGSFGRYGSGASHDFDNDVEELKLKMEGNVQKVVHLTAADEYRENFSLTNIKSSIAAGVGYELSLPGVHSDIGGGYAEFENENRNLSKEPSYKNIKAELLEQGWYTKEQLHQVETNEGDGTDHFEFDLYGIRKSIPLSYQFIPLAIMVTLAEKHDLKFKRKDIDTKGLDYNVPDDLVEAKESLLNYAIANDGAHSKGVTIRAEKLHPIRNKYLHRSTCDSIGKGGRYKDGKPYRKPIDG
jgi:hypothetical protein